MDATPQYRILFLNEVHDILRRTNPKVKTSIGLCRVLGRLLDYDPATEQARLESCFHYEHISPPRPKASSSAKHQHRRLSSQQQPGQLGKKNIHEAHDTESASDTKALENCQSNAIEINSDREDEHDGDGDVIMLDNVPPQNKAKDAFTIDLTAASTDDEMSTDEEDRNNNRNDTTEKRRDPAESHSQSRSLSTGKPGPRIILRIDTSLLGSWKTDVGGLVDFIGEIMYDRGHWVMQARTFRSMDGLDLYAYRQSILLMRSLVQSSRTDRTNEIKKEEPGKKSAK